MKLDDLRGPECLWCGKELNPSSKQMLYCCDAHNVAYQRDKQRRARLAEKASWKRRCPACDAPIPAEARANRIYCSKKCFKTVDEARNRGARRRAARAGRSCVQCGEPIDAISSRQWYCGGKCRNRAYEKRKRFRCEAAG